VSTALVVHSGGPTAVINASLLGIVEAARVTERISSVLGARGGLTGLLRADFVDLLALPQPVLSAVGEATSSALGTSRHPVSDDDFDRALLVCRKHQIRFVFYTGGNGSMETAHELQARARDAGHSLSVIGVPKTIDNDLAGTDHAPGYGSAARFFASAARDIGADNRALPGQVQVLEVLGRHVGWIAAATCLARRDDTDPPHLIYLPERRLPLRQLLDDVQRVYDRLGRCVVVVCEGQLDEHDTAFGADCRPTSRGPLAMNLAHHLSSIITEKLGLKARGEKPGLLGRVSANVRSETDWSESRQCGAAAVRAAWDGASGAMVTLNRQTAERYSATTGLVPLDRVAGIERPFPEDWMANGGSISHQFIDYAMPLTGAIAPNVYLR
jgi:ATP-dependent phosphofructokinase / diphosphate-dependent phosphofructokinase